MPPRALFLDRDGVINVDRGYVFRREEFEWMDGIFDLARTAKRLGVHLVVVTNQSGIARGYYSEERFQALTRWMEERFRAEEAALTAVYYCPFLKGPDGQDHPLRKPNPGMILQARDDLGLDLRTSAMIGDKWADMDAARAAGIGAPAIVGPRAAERESDADLAGIKRLETVRDAAPWIQTVFG